MLTAPEDRERLIDLWVRCEMDPRDLGENLRTLKWIDIGFQADDPTTDFRGTGLLGLLNLVFFLRHYEAEALECLKTSHTKDSEYFFACGGINITYALLQKVADFEFIAEFENASSPEDALYRFSQLYSQVFVRFNKYWKNSGFSDSLLNFNTVMVGLSA